MTPFIVYDTSGRILRTGSCQPCDLALQGENVIKGVADDTTQYIDAGVVVDMPLSPSKWHQFNYVTKQWDADPQAAWADVRQQRNALLSASDWTQLPDVHIDTRQAWATYRQKLRDITLQPDPLNLTWPTPPQ